MCSGVLRALRCHLEMSKICSCESNLPSGLGESDKPNSDMKC